MFFKLQSYIFCFLLVIGAGIAPSADAATFPLHDVAVSDAIDLSGQWRFKKDPGDLGEAQKWYAIGADHSEWQPIDVPGVWDEAPGAVSRDIYSGPGWYYKEIEIPADWDETVSLAFLGSIFITDVWMNGNHVGTHRGGYTPFFFIIPDDVDSGSTMHLAVRVDNRTDESTIPIYPRAWQFYGGLTRELYLLHRPMLRIENLHTHTTLLENGEVAQSINGELLNESFAQQDLMLKASLFAKDAPATPVAQREAPVSAPAGKRQAFSFALDIPDPQLWSPDDPNLYLLALEWDWNGKQRMEVPIGLRELEFRDGKMLLNGEPLWLQGFGMHEQLPGYGPCIPIGTRRQTLASMKEDYNANALRPGHYPFHPTFYDLCDELGILVIAEIPAWQIQKDTLESEMTWRNWLEPQLREMVNMLRNHPSVFIWGVANEIGFDGPAATAYYERARQLIRSMGDERPVEAVIDRDFGLESYEQSEVALRNFHYGLWHSPSVYELREGLTVNLQAAGDQPLWVTEMGSWSPFGKRDGSYGDRYRDSETYMDKVIRFDFQYCATAAEQIIGNSIWAWRDFHANDSVLPYGIFSEDGRPRLSAYTVRNLMQGDLRLFVIENQTEFNSGETFRAELFAFNPERQGAENFKAKWILKHGADSISSGAFHFNLRPARSQSIGNVEWTVPSDAEKGLHTLWVQLFDESDEWIYTNNVMFDVGTVPQTGIFHLEARYRNAAVDNAYVEFDEIRMPLFSKPGLMLALPEGDYVFEVTGKGLESRRVAMTVTNGDLTHRIIELENAAVRQNREHLLGIVGTPPPAPSPTDSNGDGRIDVADILHLLTGISKN